MNKFVKNVSYSLISNLSNMILGAIAVLIFPKFIGIDGYGYYQLFLFYSSLMIITALGWSDGYYLEIGGKNYSDLNKNQQSAHFWLLAISQTVIYILIFVFVIFLTNDNDKRNVYILSCIWALGSNPRYFLKLVLQATDCIRQYAAVTITERLVSILITLILIAFGYRNYVMLIVLEVIGRYVSLMFAIYFCRDAVFIKPQITRKIFYEVKRCIGSGITVLFATISSTLIIGVVRIGIEQCWDITMFSKVSLTISISHLAMQCINAIAIVMFPMLRRMDLKAQRVLYSKINTILMVLIFACLNFYYPVVKMLGLWLPNYQDSMKYAAILLPMCVYECKNAMLVVSYIKTLRCEKVLLWSNLWSLIASCICTVFFVYSLHNIELAVFSIFFVLMIRCNISEYWLNKTLKIHLVKDTVLEISICLIFIICNWYLGMVGMFVYTSCFIIYVFFLKRTDILDAMKLIRKKAG